MAREVYKLVCQNCGKRFNSYRPDAKYHSASCRSAAFRKRKDVEKKMRTSGLSDAVLEDVKELRVYSGEAADNVLKVAAVCGAEAAQWVLDACWSLLVQNPAFLESRLAKDGTWSKRGSGQSVTSS